MKHVGVYIREKNGLIGIVLQLRFTMSLTLVKQSRFVLLKDKSDYYCVYKMNDAVFASFLYAIVGERVRRQEQHRAFSVGIISHLTLLVLYTYYILFVHLL